MNRRVHHTCALLLSFVVSIVAFPVSLAAQGATPATGGSLLEGLGLPTLEVTITSDGIDSPAEIAAGPTMLVVDNQTDGFTVSSISQLPEDITDDQYIDVLTGDAFPEWVAEAVVGGGFDLPPMTRASAVIDLAVGDWRIGVSGDAPIATQVVTLTVAGDASTGAADTVPADLVVSLGAYAFDVPDTIQAGPQVWQITNTHTVLHHIVVFPADRLYTADEVHDSIMAAFGGSPVADGFSLDVNPVFASSALSEGQSMWFELDLPTGYYVAICFLPDPGSDVPHVMAGMIDTFEATAG